MPSRSPLALVPVSGAASGRRAGGRASEATGCLGRQQSFSGRARNQPGGLVAWIATYKSTWWNMVLPQKEDSLFSAILGIRTRWLQGMGSDSEGIRSSH